MAVLCACTGNNTRKDIPDGDSDSIKAAMLPKVDTVSLPAKQLESVSEIRYNITVFDTLTSGKLSHYDDAYDNTPGHFTFRKNAKRDANFGGTVKGTPTKVVKIWSFETAFSNTKTNHGTWGGGTGWTGEPIYVEWPDSMVQRFKESSPALTADFGKKEIIVASLCSNAYFINFDNGKASRQPLNVENPVKGSASLDPCLNGNLYIGQGVCAGPEVSQLCINLFKHEITFRSGRDRNAYRGWNAYDSSPIVVGGFLFWPGENATIYKYKVLDGTIKLHSTLRYTAVGDGGAGVENSLCAYKNYGYFGDNHGDILCIDLNTMTPIWHYDNHDDIDGSLVCQVEDGVPYLYGGCEVDRQGNSGTCHFIKLNGLTGELMWDQQIPCNKLNLNGKHFDGGLYCTPLLGHGDCEGMVFANICQRGTSGHAEFTAFNAKNGEVIYRSPLRFFSWTSPVAFYNENNKLFIFTGDSSGNAYLINGKTGEIIFTEHMVDNFESSPVVVGNEFVVGSRGNLIHKFAIQ